MFASSTMTEHLARAVVGAAALIAGIIFSGDSPS
jgi:hypothetical protein